MGGCFVGTWEATLQALQDPVKRPDLGNLFQMTSSNAEVHGSIWTTICSPRTSESRSVELLVAHRA